MSAGLKLKSVAYTSRARLDLSDQDLDDIHRVARHLNALDGITGLLVFDGVRFLQIVEGAEDAVDHLVRRLLTDQRHTSLEIRDEHSLESRSFPDWSMELVRVSLGMRYAQSEISRALGERVPPAVRDLALRMTADIG